MPVVSNTSPILNLAIIHQLDLLRARLSGQIASLESMLSTLQNEAGFYIAADLMAAILHEAGER